MSFLKKLAERTQQVVSAAVETAREKYENLKVSDEQHEERYDICKRCPHFISVTTTCTKCGCFMAAKTYLATAECPVGKWGVILLVEDK